MDDIALLNAESSAQEARARVLRQQQTVAETWVPQQVVAEMSVQVCENCHGEQTVDAQTYVKFAHRGAFRLLATPIPQLPFGLPRHVANTRHNVAFCPKCVAAQFVDESEGF
jgi:hypothetical protein